jgi:tripartite-type tricarboxylate transporter receptor subunit TctC
VLLCEANPMLSRRRFLKHTAAAALASALMRFVEPVLAMPLAKTARLIVGFPPGGAPDVVARLIAENLNGYAPSLVVDNHPGAGGRLALQALKGAPNDGSVMALTPVDQLALFPHVYKQLGYQPREDFAAVTPICSVEFLVVIGPAVPPSVRTVDEFIDWCKQTPKRASYGTAGAGTHPHFLGMTFAHAAGLDLLHVPYKGGVSAMQDVLGGHLAASVGTIGTFLASVQSGGLRALATTAPRRSAALPHVPTFAEVGYPALESLERFGLVLPARTPADIVRALYKAVRQAIETDAVKGGLGKLSFEPAPASPAEFTRLIESETRRWGAIVKATRFNPLD